MAETTLSSKEIKFWRAEMKLLDDLYKERMIEWQKLIDLYELRFENKIRDLDVTEMVRVPMFYTVVRQIIATVAFNYPKLFFTVEDDEGAGYDVADVLERASSAYLRVSDLKPHVHQGIFDAVSCGIGWLRADYNPPGDDLIPPYVANDAMEEDMVIYNRVPPGFVHLDPQCPPHVLGHARYIRERMWLPLEFLKKDPEIKHKDQIKATTADKKDEMGQGEPTALQAETAETKAVRESLKNGEFVLCDRIHDRINRRLVMFAEGVEDEILIKRHPFANMIFDPKLDSLGNVITQPGTETPVLDMEQGKEAAGWLVESGFQFVPIKFDLSAQNYYPTPHLEYLKDLQDGLVESMSRMSALLKRIARQALIKDTELEEHPELPDRLRRGNDGEYHPVKDLDSVRELNWGSVPSDQYAFEDRCRFYSDATSQVNELAQGGGEEARTATEAGLIAAAASINREWLEAKVAAAYELCVRNAFQVFGDPRYTPENFVVNVAPEGQEKLNRALTSADFMWNFRINVQAGSTRPLFEQLQRVQAVDFWDRAILRPNFDQMELDKFLASAYEIVDPEKLLKDDVNEEAQRAVQLENFLMVTQMDDPGVFPGQDHQVHLEGHGQYQMVPMYQQLLQAAQSVDPATGLPVDPEAAMKLQRIEQVAQQHMVQHQHQLQDEQAAATAPGGGARGGSMPLDTMQGQVQSNAQRMSEQVQADTTDVVG